MIIPLFDEGDLLWFAVAFKRHIFNHMNTSINKLLFWKQALEDQFSVSNIKTVEVFSLDLLLSAN